MFPPLRSFSALLLALAESAFAQNTGDPIEYDLLHNVTSIYGTWSTGSMHVVTGQNFARPAEQLFVYPSTTGVSVSFAENGWFEYAQYSFTSNGTDPSCIVGYMLWTHGEFTQEVNGSMYLVPNGDGYQQVQSACGAISNLIENNNDTISIPWWTISQDTEKGYVLKMQKFDLTWYAPFFQVSTTPEMLPTQKLRNVTLGPDVAIGRRELDERSGAVAARTVSLTAGVVGLALLAMIV